MLSINKLTIETLKGRKLIKDLSFELNAGDKLAIIGEEGNGKSTLLKAIYDKNLIKDYCLITGEIKTNQKLGYLEQKISNYWQNFSVFDYLTYINPNQFNYDILSNNLLNIYMNEFNLNKDILRNNILIKNLSGGEQVKLQLLKILLQEPTILLLDEPTNDLDIETLQWLEQFIKSYKNPIIFISHDETLLENCANIILHIEQLIKKTQPKHTLFRGNYNDYVEIRQNSIEKQTQVALYERAQDEKRMEKWQKIYNKVNNDLHSISRRDPHGGFLLKKKMQSVKSQEKRFERERKEFTEIPDVEESIKLLVDENVTFPNQKILLDININELTVPNKTLSRNINLLIKGPQKLAIIGQNGCGKTTLLNTLLPVLKQTTGLKVGHFSQNYAETLNFNKTPIEELSIANAQCNPQTYLGSLKFTTEEMTHKIANLSEGQKAKLLLLKLIVEKNNVLVLDEPTRNLSPLSNPVIRAMLNKYNGAIIAVSHDRKFIKNVCNLVYKLDKNGLHTVEITNL